MKVTLKKLPDELRGGAWPSPARAVRRPVKSGNERDPHCKLLSLPERVMGLICRTAIAKMEEGGGHGRSVCPETLGPHAGCNDRDNGLRPRKRKEILKPYPSYD